jgi:hypothetical protein
MLTENARAGQTSAMIALERALRKRSTGLRNEPWTKTTANSSGC